MAAGTYNIVIEQGATFQRTITVTDSGVARDLTGYLIRMHVRQYHSDTATILEMEIGDGITVTDAAAGEFELLLSATQTAALPVVSNYRYDLELEDTAGDVERLLEGTFTVSPEVTR